jgi:hypothetical protein
MFINPKILFKASENEKKINFFCQFCNYPFSSHEDFAKRDEYNCCNFCFLSFVEARREEYKNGWRPNKKEIAARVKIKKQSNSSIITIKEK